MENRKPERRNIPMELNDAAMENVNGGSGVHSEFSVQPRSAACPCCGRAIQIFTNEAVTLKCPYCNAAYRVE